MRKKFFTLLLVMILTVSTIGLSTAEAKISGSSQVVAGKTYTIKISKSATASSISGRISWSGFASGSETMWKDSTSGMSESITASVSIKIAVPAGTPAGSTCTISLSGEIATSDGTNVGESAYSESKTLTVVTKEASSNTSEGDEPKATKAPTEWEVAKDKFAGTEQGGTATIDITGDDHKIPASMYNSLREKQNILTVNFPTYSCTLNGAVLGELGKNTKSLDLGLTFDPDPDFSAAVGGQDIYQLHFSHEGEFPGKISFKFKADKNVPGDTVYLYYYYGSSKVIQSMQSAVVDSDGFVTFDIFHCSNYFVSSAIIEGASGVVVQPTPEPTPEPTPTATLAPEPTPEPTPVPTESAEPVMASATGFPLVVLIIVSGGAALIAVLITMLAFKVGPFKKKSRHAA